jgi:hypothetical protein
VIKALWIWIIWGTFVVAWMLSLTDDAPAGTNQASTWVAIAATAAIIATRQARARR